MTLFTNVTECNNDSSSSSSSSTSSSSSKENCLEYNKTRPEKDDNLTNYDNTGFTTVANSYEYTIPEATDLAILNTPTTDATKRYQTKMLLASLIEHFCRAYGDTPDANRKVFFLICQTLRSLGIIDSEFVDEMTSVRSSFQQAFHKLFYTAVQTVQSQDLVPFDDGRSPKLIKNEQTDYFGLSPEPTSPSCFSNSPTRLSSSTTNSTLHSFVLGNLSVQNSRYNHDFVEINLLGKGGFASAFRARNKLDGIDYAVKKIRLGNNIEDEAGDNPYERIFREIKNLARLEHNNVIRYYSSWLEFDESNSDETDTSDEESDITRPTSTSSVFGGQDPTFDMSESGMSQIMFAESSATCEPVSTSEPMSSFPKPLGHKGETEEEASLTATSQSGWTLFIQMQLCPTTLHDYIKYRNKQFAEKDPSNFAMDRTHKNRNIEIFSQILQGTAYIHDQGLIHRDLKPSNIFLSIPNVPHDNSKKRRSSNAFLDTVTEKNWQEAWVPKIGDFGLAAEVMDESDLLLTTPLSSRPPSPTQRLQQIRRASVYEGRPTRPRPKRTRTVGVGTRTVSIFF